jgi:hypothetical protein
MKPPSLKEAQAISMQLKRDTVVLNDSIANACNHGIKVELEAMEVTTIGKPNRPIINVTPRIDVTQLREED